jgi:hypothetical protein
LLWQRETSRVPEGSNPLPQQLEELILARTFDLASRNTPGLLVFVSPHIFLLVRPAGGQDPILDTSKGANSTVRVWPPKRRFAAT